MSYLRRFFTFLWQRLRDCFSPQIFLRLSPAALVAMLTAVFLVICVTVVYFVRIRAQQGIYDQAWWWTFSGVVALVIVIPIVVYFAVKWWLHDEPTKFPDIEQAWTSGMAELRRRGFDLRQIPTFLVLGLENDAFERSLFASSHLSMVISGHPQGSAALHWYATQDAVFISCTNLGCLSWLAHEATRLVESQLPKLEDTTPRDQTLMTMTCWPTSEDRVAAVSGQTAMSRTAYGRSMTSDVEEAVGTGTAFIDDLRVKEQLARLNIPSTGGRSLRMTRQEVEEQRQRLEYLTRLITMARRPYCPINGILVSLPLNQILCDTREGVQTREAIATDLRQLRRGLELRCPVYAVVSGWQDDLGFQEFMRRMGRRRVQANRFGKGTKDQRVFHNPETSQVEALCQHACGAFEDWIYHLFGERETLSKADAANRALYGLVCKIRRYLLPRLQCILTGAFQDETGEPQFFGGCYFAATGSAREQQAFSIKVFERLVEDQEELQWAASAQRTNRLHRRIAYAAFASAGTLILATAGLICWRILATPL